MNDISIAVLVSFAVGTVLGLFWGWSKGIMHGKTATLSILIEDNFLLTKKVGNETMILPLDYQDTSDIDSVNLSDS